MTKIVINAAYGGFSVSEWGVRKLREWGNAIALKDVLKGERYKNGEVCKFDYGSCRDIARNDKDLVRLVEEYPNEANGSCAKLEVVEIPDDVEWEIDSYDGWESIEEKHRSWG
jgi:hypothetical protein